MTQAVELLFCKCEALSSNSGPHQKKKKKERKERRAIPLVNFVLVILEMEVF
jgi:hypothetical protein